MRTPWLVRSSLPLLLLCVAESAAAQRDELGGLLDRRERRGFIGLGIGPSVPLGAFTEASSVVEGTGRAAAGYTSTFLNIGYRFRSRLGIAAAAAYGQYDMRDGGGDDWWEIATLTIGPMYTRPLGARAALDLKAMFGMFAVTPVVDSYETDARTGAGLGIDMRATLRYDVLERWAVFAEGGVQASGVSFPSDAETSYGALISGLGVAFRPTWGGRGTR